MTSLEHKIISMCIEELEDTLTNMPPKEADKKVKDVKDLLDFLIEADK